ncbi:MAG TPA: hypothetical protein VKP11_07965 [Frankiaceae bacterium]|nr:hypothetical protein [Frankiaceae bacterium]
MNALAVIRFGGADRLDPALLGVVVAALAVLVVVLLVRKILHLAALAAVVAVLVLAYHFGYLPPRGL